jgi:hypothetical protein
MNNQKTIDFFLMMVEFYRYAFEAFRKLIFKMVKSLVAVCSRYEFSDGLK